MTNTPSTTAMTLRLQPHISEAVENVASDLSMTKTQWIRRAIRQGLSHSQQHELPLITPAIRAALRP